MAKPAEFKWDHGIRKSWNGLGGKDLKAPPVPALPQQGHLHCPRIMPAPSKGRWHNQDGNVPQARGAWGNWWNQRAPLNSQQEKYPALGEREISFLPAPIVTQLKWPHCRDKGTTVAPEQQPEVELLGKERQDLGTQLLQQHDLKPLKSPGSHWKVLRCFKMEYLDFKKNKVPIGKVWI